MTAVAQPPGLKKLAVRYNPSALAELKSDSQLQKSRRLDQQLQSSYNVSQTQNSSSASYPYPETNITSGAHRLVSTPILPDVISGPLRNITKYRLQIPDPTSSDAPASSSITSTSAAAAEAPGALPSPSASFPPPPKEELIEKEKLTRAYKLGSSWVPVEEEDELTAGKAGMSVGGRFETKKGLDVFSFLYAANVSRTRLLLEKFDQRQYVDLHAQVLTLFLTPFFALFSSIAPSPCQKFTLCTPFRRPLALKSSSPLSSKLCFTTQKGKCTYFSAS